MRRMNAAQNVKAAMKCIFLTQSMDMDVYVGSMPITVTGFVIRRPVMNSVTIDSTMIQWKIRRNGLNR